MKNRIVLILCIGIAAFSSALAYADCSCECKTTSHSTFVENKEFYSSAAPPRITLFHDRLDVNDKDKWAGAVQATIFGGKSTEKDKLARYFFPFCKTQLTVSNDITKNPDLLAQQFNIYTQYAEGAVTEPEKFDSKISICPSQSFVGVGLTWRQGFWHREEKDLWFWFELSMPITHLHNKMCLSEQVINGENATFINDALPHNMTEALRQSSWCYGKIIDGCCTNNCCTTNNNCNTNFYGNKACCDTKNDCMKETGVADIEIKLGYEWFNTECCFFESYIGALVPTGTTPKACYMFEPVVGHNKHAGVFIGTTSIVEVWHSECTDSEIDFVTDGYGLYLFGKCERRPFDLKYRPWSRYMQVYANKAQAEEAEALAQTDQNAAMMLHTPGINVFTKDLYVEPRFVAISNFAVFWNYKAWQTEVGYNFYARAAECVKLNCPWQQGPALKAIFPPALAQGGWTNPVQTIGTAFRTISPVEQPAEVADYNENLIQACDLDLESAAHPAVFTHTLYASIGYRWDDYKYPWFLGIGGSYEYSDENTGLTRGMGWAKGGISF